MPLRKCNNPKCSVEYWANQADLNRGWGKHCSKRCAAIVRTKRELNGNFQITQGTKRYRRYRTNNLTRRNQHFVRVGMMSTYEAEIKSERDRDHHRLVDDFDPSWDAHKSY